MQLTSLLLTCLAAATTTTALASPEPVPTTPIPPTQTISSLPYCPPRAVSNPQEQEWIFKAFVINLASPSSSITDTFTTYVAEDYIQHNPSVLSGRQNAINALSTFMPLVNVTTLRMSFDATTDGGLGWVHSRLERLGEDGTVSVAGVMDVFRMNGSCVQEHWDVVQSVPEGSINPIAMF